MKKHLKLALITLLFGVVVSGLNPVNTYAAPNSVSTSDGGTSRSCRSNFLGFPAWYDGVTNSDCSIKVPDSTDGASMSNFIWRIALNILQIAITAVAYVSTFYIIYGGFQYLLSRGSSDGMKKGKNAILNAVIGLVIALMAIGVINLIVKGLGL